MAIRPFQVFAERFGRLWAPKLAGLVQDKEPPLTVVVDALAAAANLLELRTETLVSASAGQRLPLKTRRVMAYNVSLVGGPHEDGATANASDVFVGGENVSPTHGVRLTPGSALPIGVLPPVCDLSKVFAHFVGAADVVRYSYWS